MLENRFTENESPLTSNSSGSQKNELAHTLLKDVLSTSKIVTTYSRCNPYDKLSKESSEFRTVVASVNYEFWALLGFLYESKALALDYLLRSTNGKYSFTPLKASFVDLGAQAKVNVTINGAEYEVTFDAISVIKPLLDKLSAYTKFLRNGYLPFGQLSDLFESRPFHLTYPDIVPSLPFFEEEDIEHRPGRIASLGQELQPVTVQLGRVWLKKFVGSDELPALSTVSRLREVQVNVLQNFLAGPMLEEMKVLTDLLDSVRKEIARAKFQRFCVAFCGMVKAGKSLFLNALTGRQLLPSDELPATAWPCRLRHDPNAQIPQLVVNTKYFDAPLKELRRRGIGAAMESYKPPDDYLLTLAGDDDDDDYSFDGSDNTSFQISGRDGDDSALYHDWKDLHEYTKHNLKTFEDPSFRLPSSASGDEAVVHLLGKVNDIIRLCRIFKITVPEAKPDTWPCLTVEFESLRDKTIEGTFELIDLPGIGEAHSDFHSFEDLVRIAAREADTVVPIVSFNEVAKGDWRRQLPAIVNTGLKRPPDFVLCTHMDQFIIQVQTKSRVIEQVASVGKEFWPTITGFERRVLRCSSRLGIGARMLLAQSQHKKPKFESIWKENVITYDCVEKILGVGDAKQKYEVLKREEWIEALQQQLQNSRLQEAMYQLTAGIVNSAQGLALKVEGMKLMLMMRKIASEQKRWLVEISRSQGEFEQAYGTFQQMQSKTEKFRGICKEESLKLKVSVAVRLDEAFAELEQNGQKSAILAVETAAKRVDHHVPKSGSSKTNEIVFKNKLGLKEFFYVAQDKMARDAKDTLIKDIVPIVRQLDRRSRMQFVQLLVFKLESVMEEQAPPELDGDILDKKGYQSQDVDVLFSASLKRKLFRTLSQPDGLAASELGYMINAPFDILGTIPPVLKPSVWPWSAQKRKFSIDKSALAKHLQDQSMRYFTDSKKEAEKTLESVIMRCSQQIQEIVNESWKEEQAELDGDPSLKKFKLSVRDTISLAVDTVLTFWNLSATEAALNELQVHFEEVLQRL